jgi:serine/threonine-protein kinase
VGEALGPYDLLEELGRGGMGVVYRAVHRPTGAVRALKVLDHAPDAEAMERFRREAAALARAAGEGVVPVHDLGVAGGRLFFAMPLLEGGSLQARLARSGPLPWRDACALAREVARALERCHAAGLVHRDLKPANLLLDAAGRVHLADFGCVRDLAALRLTQTGTLIGTPLYMPPELAGSAKADPRADVYSLGAVLYELVVGQAPYRGASSVQVLGQALAGRRDPLPASAPRALEALIAGALAPEPANRIGSASELAARLDEVLAGAAGQGGPWPRSAVVAAGVAAVLVVLALVARSPRATPGSPPRSVDRATASDAPPPPAPVDELAPVRAVLGRRFARDSDLIRELERVVPVSPAMVDPALAAEVVAAVSTDDLVLASRAFAVAARLHELVPQPAGVSERLERELFMTPGVGAEVLVALLRLGRRPPPRFVVGHEDALEAAVAAGGATWPEELALSHVLHEAAYEARNTAPEEVVAKMRAHGAALATRVDGRAGLPRCARAAARLLILQHRFASRRPESRPLTPDLPRLMKLAEDLDWADGAYVMAADAAIDEGDLDAARPFIDGARRWAERVVAPDSDLSAGSPPGRPWVAPVAPPTSRSEGVLRLEALLRLVDDRADPRAALEGLDQDARELLHRQLMRLGRVEEAERVAAAMPPSPRAR